MIRVTGRLRVEMRYGMEIRLVAGSVEVLDGEAVRPPAYAEAGGGRMTIEALKAMPVNRHPFPPIVADPYKVIIVQSVSAQARVAQDCEGELQGLVDEGLIEIYPVKVNIADPLSIARAIHEARSDILIVIRGGGDAREFEVFDDPRVVTALAGNTAYRVTGLGHSGDSTLLDLVADYSASTPTAAGGHVRGAVLDGEHRRRAVREAIEHATSATRQALGAEASSTTGNTQAEGGAVAWYWLVVAGAIMGGLLGWLFARWA
jgi:exodeoxyribonuclease VII large subunit